MKSSTSNSILLNIIKNKEKAFKYDLINWIPIKNLNWKYLSSNPNAIELLEEKIKIEKRLTKSEYNKLNNKKKIDWIALSSNPNAIELLQENPKNIDWEALSSNPSAIELLKKNRKKIDWEALSSNPSAIELLKKNPEKIDWYALSSNSNAIRLLEENPEKIYWKDLSSNINAIRLLEEKIKIEPSKIDWEKLSSNPNAIKLLRENTDKIVWHYLSSNPNAIKLFTANPEKIDWWFLSRNPNPHVIALLKTNQDEIDWNEFSKNPSIFIKKKEKKNMCSQILTPKQVGAICWFMAAFVAMFYSQRSRKILLDAANGWDKTKLLFEILHYILNDKYLKVGSNESANYEYFKQVAFMDILLYLNKENNKVFPYDPRVLSGGFHSEFYIGKLYKLLNIDYRMYDYNMTDNVLAYSFLNEDFNSIIYKIKNKNISVYINGNNTFKYIEDSISPPPILIIIVRDDKENTSIYKDLFPNNIINDGNTKDSLKSMEEKIFYRGVEYNLDSVILANWNINKDNGHAIAGITCKKDHYVYNGWTRTSMDPVMGKNITRNIPCELMKYDWNIQNNGDFCLNTAKCIPDVLKHKLKHHDICFNFSKGKRILIYVRKDAKPDTSMNTVPNIVVPNTVVPNTVVPIKSPKKCPDGKVLNPKTGRCILIKNAKAVINKSPKSLKLLKKCPEGKVLNPKTGHCILIKNAKAVINKSPKSLK